MKNSPKQTFPAGLIRASQSGHSGLVADFPQADIAVLRPGKAEDWFRFTSFSNPQSERVSSNRLCSGLKEGNDFARHIEEEQTMFKHVLAGVILSLAPVYGFAQSAERSITMEVNATVRSVDAETRTIVLDNATTGQSEIIIAGPEIINFDQIEAGDKVKAIYTLGIAARMAMPDEMDRAVEVDGRAIEGEKPGALTGTAVTLVLEFVSFDNDASIATVKDSDGMEQMIEVKSDAGRAFASDLKAGDMVALTFAEGLALGIVEE